MRQTADDSSFDSSPRGLGNLEVLAVCDENGRHGDCRNLIAQCHGLCVRQSRTRLGELAWQRQPQHCQRRHNLRFRPIEHIGHLADRMTVAAQASIDPKTGNVQLTNYMGMPPVLKDITSKTAS